MYGMYVYIYIFFTNLWHKIDKEPYGQKQHDGMHCMTAEKLFLVLSPTEILSTPFSFTLLQKINKIKTAHD